MKIRILLTALFAASLSLAAHAANRDNVLNKNYHFDEEDGKPWVEGDFALPAYPQNANWLPFDMGHLYKNSYFIDGNSVFAGKDGAVRFILKITSPSGVNNLSVEGIQCKEASFRAYAFGDETAKNWIVSMNPAWQGIARSDLLHRQLRELVCPDGIAPQGKDEVIKRLQKG